LLARAEFFSATRLAPTRIQIIFACMFDLTRREQAVVAGFLVLLVLGLGVKHWRETRGLQPMSPTVGQNQ